MRILLVEDDVHIARALSEALGAAGWVVEHASDGEDAWFRGDTEAYAAVVLDLGLPGLDGLSVLRRWRKAGRTMPVLIVSARGTWSERVEGIDLGADDYIAKPFAVEEVLARLRALVRRASGTASPLLEVGPVVLDQRRMAVTVSGAPVNLSPLEFRLLCHLMLNAGRVVSQAELGEQVHGDRSERESNAIEVIVGRIRRKLGVGLIETRRGFGYIVAADKP
jgi:two-component system OmpR family response regulator